MRLADQAIAEFLEVWQEEYGERLTWEDGVLAATRFLETIRLILDRSEAMKGASHSARE